MNKYYGDSLIKEINGNTVILENGKEVYLNDTQLGYLVTDEPKDLTQLRWLMLDNVVPELFTVIEKHNIKKGDFQAILQSLVGGFNDAFNKAIGKAFGTYEEWLHPEYFIDNITVSDIQKFII